MIDYRPRSGLLAERVLLVTGAGSGIGRVAAETCARFGATVILCGHIQSELEAVYDAIEQAGGPTPAIVALDFLRAPPERYAESAEAVAANFGQLDGLLHCATELGALSPLEHYDLELWTRVMQVNLHGPLLLTRALLPLLRRAPEASIVFTTAAVGRRGRAYWGAYGVSQFALEGMTQILADELEANTGIRVNSLDPGTVRTAFFRRAYPALDPASCPLPESVMPAFLYLLGPDSRGLTGRAFSAQSA